MSKQPKQKPAPELRSRAEIEKLLAEIEADERLDYPLATIVENAPLALIQLSGKTKSDTLRWVLGLEQKKWPKRKET